MEEKPVSFTLPAEMYDYLNNQLETSEISIDELARDLMIRTILKMQEYDRAENLDQSDSENYEPNELTRRTMEESDRGENLEHHESQEEFFKNLDLNDDKDKASD